MSPSHPFLPGLLVLSRLLGLETLLKVEQFVVDILVVFVAFVLGVVGSLPLLKVVELARAQIPAELRSLIQDD